jgi:hypothetical protein
MFGELPKIFERNFVVGYVLPSALFLLLSLGLTHDVDLRTFLTTSDGASFAVVAFGLGVLLLAGNRTITRLLEGYGPLSWIRIMTWIQRWRFNRLIARLKVVKNEARGYKARGEDIPEEVGKLGEKLETRLVERFPYEERLVLPTAFGNCVRAFESYPDVMYKVEIIEGWSRLIAVIPGEYLELINTAKAETDMWINLWFLSLIAAADVMFTHRHLLVTLSSDNLAPYVRPVLTIVGTLGFAFFASWMGARAAIEWGSTFKAAVDVYLPALYEQLGFPAPTSNEDAKERWNKFSKAISYRRPEAMPERRWVAPTSPPESAAKPPAIVRTAPASPASAAAAKTSTASDPKTGPLAARPTNGLQSVKDGSPTASPEGARGETVPGKFT